MKRFAFALLAVIAGCAVLPSNSLAAGGTYDVVFCHELHRLFGGTIDSTNSFSARSRCSDPQSNQSRSTTSSEPLKAGRLRPTGRSTTHLESRAYRSTPGCGERTATDPRCTWPTAMGTRRTPLPLAIRRAMGRSRTLGRQPQRRFVASLECGQSPSCAASEHARTWVQNVRLTVADEADPEVRSVGSCLPPDG